MNYTKLFRQFKPRTDAPGMDVSACVQIHANHYVCTVEHILEMVAELKKDFPQLKDKDINVQKYGGRRIKGITFVEAFFNHEVRTAPDYKEVTEIEYIL